MTEKLNKFSSRITEPRSQGASQAMLYGTGLKTEDLAKAEVGISSVWWEGNTCNMHLNDLAALIKKGVVDAGLVDRPTPRLVEGLETFARIIHPELFGDKIEQ